MFEVWSLKFEIVNEIEVCDTLQMLVRAAQQTPANGKKGNTTTHPLLQTNNPKKKIKKKKGESQITAQVSILHIHFVNTSEWNSLYPRLVGSLNKKKYFEIKFEIFIFDMMYLLIPKSSHMGCVPNDPLLFRGQK